MNRRFSLNQLLPRLGGRYLLVTLAIAQIIALLGSIPGIISIQTNVEFDAQQLRNFSILVPLLVLIANAFLLFVVWWLTPLSRKRLDLWAEGNLKPNQEEEFTAWREITGLTW